MDYKIIASDLDGTLLNNKVTVSDENVKAIAKLKELGVEFVPASGRTISEIIPDVYNLPGVRYFIYSNGAGIYDKLTDTHTLMCMPKKLSNKILDIVNSYKTHVTIRHKGISNVDAKMQSEHDWEYYNVFAPHIVVVKHFAKHWDDFKKYSYNADNVEVISAFFHDRSEFEDCKQKLVATNEVIVVEGSDLNCEIISNHAGKGNALIKLANMLNVPISQTISVGDSGNDIPMTLTAGLSLAVKNASESLKKVAKKIICSNEEHIAKYIYENFIK